MAVVTTTGAGNWSSGSSVFSGGSGPGGVPSNADTVTISHAITLDTTAAVCSTLTIASGGTLQQHASNSGKVVIQTTLTINSGGNLSADMTGNATQTFDIWLNNSAAAAADYFVVADGGSYTLKGFVRKRWTTLSAAVAVSDTTASVTDATGWQSGDRLVFGTTQAYNATPRIDVRTATVSGTSLSAMTAMTYAHASGGLIGNFSSNLTIRAGSLGSAWRAQISTAATPTSCTRIMTDVLIDTLNGRWRFTGNFAGRAAAATNYWGAHSNNALYDNRSAGFDYNTLFQPIVRQNNIAYGPTCNQYNFGTIANNGNIGSEDACVSFAANGSSGYGFYGGLGYSVDNCYSMAANLGGIAASYIDNCDSYSNGYGIYSYSNATRIEGSTNRLGTQFSAAATNSTGIYQEAFTTVDLTDTHIQASNSNNALTYTTTGSYLALSNKNADVTSQELYLPQGTVKRNNSEVKRSTSSVAIKPSTLLTDTPYTVSISCANGASIRVVGYCKADTSFYNGGGSGWTAPTVTISGLGITAQVFTASSAANNAFEAFDLSVTNSSGADGNFTLTFNANAKSVTTGTVYFDGVPTASPYVTKARHYGFQIDQTVPNATVNSSVSASEATALGYSGDFTITGGASTSSIALVNSSTFQKTYDYTQAWACTTANLGYAIPCTSPAGSANLIAGSNVTVPTTKVLNGTGSIAMGAKTLTTEFAGAIAYTYTGGTFSQATTVPGFAGGTLNLGAAGTYTFDTTGTVIISMTPTAPGTYVMSAVTANGQLDLRNTAAHAITVELSTAAAALAITTNNTGGTITVSAPQVYQSVSLSGLSTTCRVQLYDTALSSELYNAEPGTITLTWTDSVAAAAARPIRLRITDYLGATAMLMVDRNIGICATTGAGVAVSYTHAEEADTNYNAQAAALGYNGADVTDITIVDATDIVQFNFLTGGDYDARRIYMYMVYWLDTEEGIRDDFVFCSPLDPVNLPMTGVQFENVTSPQEIITFINAYVYDATTGRAKDLIVGDGINFAPDHVVQVIATVSGVNIITGDIADVLTAVGNVPAAVVDDPKTLTVPKFMGLK